LNSITVFQNLCRQFPKKGAAAFSFSAVEKSLQKQLGLTGAVFLLRSEKTLKTIDGKKHLSVSAQKDVFARLSRSLKPWILNRKGGSQWLGFWPVVIGKDWVGCFALGRKAGSRNLSGEEKQLLELLTERTAFYLEEHRLWEKIERADRQASLGFMSAAVLHEIRCPLSALSTMVQLLQEKKNDKLFMASFPSLMIHQINRLTVMADTFLSFVEISPKGKIRIDFSGLVNQTAKLLGPLFMVKRVRLIVENSEGLFLKGNEQQLESLLLNLLKNALESANFGGKVVLSTTLLSQPSDGHGPWIELNVRDNGNGISKENLEKIFEPYFSTREKGTGLGLAICQRVVENHKGKIKAKSSKQGTLFQVFIPAVRKP
jgi:signal transduction histidine kinase